MACGGWIHIWAGLRARQPPRMVPATCARALPVRCRADGSVRASAAAQLPSDDGSLAARRQGLAGGTDSCCQAPRVARRRGDSHKHDFASGKSRVENGLQWTAAAHSARRGCPIPRRRHNAYTVAREPPTSEPPAATRLVSTLARLTPMCADCLRAARQCPIACLFVRVQVCPSGRKAGWAR